MSAMTRQDVLEVARLARKAGTRPNLHDANLRCANLRGADLHGAFGGLLSVAGLPSGDVLVVPTCHGWVRRVGCWSGTTDELRVIARSDDPADWPGASDAGEIACRRPLLLAVADLMDAHEAANADALAAVAHWADQAVTP